MYIIYIYIYIYTYIHTYIHIRTKSCCRQNWDQRDETYNKYRAAAIRNKDSLSSLHINHHHVATVHPEPRPHTYTHIHEPRQTHTYTHIHEPRQTQNCIGAVHVSSYMIYAAS